MPKENERPKKASSVNQFCEDHDICRATLYNEWRRGRGPRRAKIGNRTVIFDDAAADYRAECEARARAGNTP